MKPPEEFIPECINGREHSYSVHGYIIPCCYLDNNRLEAIRKFGMLRDKFHISNLEDISDVFESDEWLLFFDTLQNDYHNVHDYCKERCNPTFKEREQISLTNI